MKKLLLAVLVLAMVLSAAVVSVERAKKVAENWYYNYDTVLASKASVVEKVLTKEYLGQPTWYVFKFTKGFVIVAAEDNVNPILGFAYEGYIEDEDINNLRNPFASRFSSYDKQIVHNIREKKADRPAKQKEWLDIEKNTFQTRPRATKDVANFITTQWHQDYPFNDICPTGSPVGCVATAMSQILYFYAGPATGAGSNSYTDLAGDITGSHSVDFSAQTYDYELIANNPYGSSFGTQAEVDEIAKISYHLGVSVDMDYNTSASGGSGAYMIDVAPVLQNNWASPTASYNSHGNIADSSYFSATIKTEIDNLRPLEWGGQGADGGHAFVLSGYQNLAAGGYWYWFNWGWGGSYNGWFRLNDLSPGTYDFSLSQSSVKGIYVNGLLQQMPPPATNTGSVLNGNVTVDWTAPNPVTPMGTLTDYQVYRDGVLVHSMGGTATTVWTENALYEGSFNYTVKAVYLNPDGVSLPSPSYIASVTQNPTYPCPLMLTAESYLNVRSKIDLAWSKPFVGTTYLNDTFETGNTHGVIPTGWWQKGAALKVPTTWSNIDDATYLGWIAIGKTNYPQWVFQGNYSCGANGDGEQFAYQFLITNTSFTLPGGSGAVDYYTFYYDGTEQGIFLFSGTLGDTNPSGKITMVKEYTTGAETWEHDAVSLAPYTGTYRFGFYKKTIGGGSLLCFDNVILGVDTYPLGMQPTHYEIYNNGTLETTVAITGLTQTYASTGFDDGLNQYYVRAKYADGGTKYSIASNPATAWIDANPQPYFLAGSYDGVNDECDISWYAPNHYPDGWWFAYQWENDSWNYVAYATFAAGSITKVRTYYTAEEFGMSYPVYISQLSAAFYEDAGVEDWASTQFKIAIGTGGEGTEVFLHTSANKTAIEDGTWVDYVLPQTYTINAPWFVEVQPQAPTSGTPNVLTYVHEEGVDADQWNSVVYWTGDGTSAAGWYAISYNSPYEYEDWAFVCYGHNDEPTITKDGKTTTREPVAFTSIKSKKDIKKSTTTLSRTGSQPKQHEGIKYLASADDSKGLNQYQIWRNDARYATVAGNVKVYTDTNPIVSNTYYITALYTIPTGESVGSNEITLGPPPVAAYPATITKTVPPGQNQQGTFLLGNTGAGYLHYSMEFKYTDAMTQTVTPVNEHFASSLGTFTSSANWAYSTTAPVYETGHARIASSGSAVRSGYLTKTTNFDLSGLTGTKLEFAYIHSATATSEYIRVETSTDGTNFTTLQTYAANTAGAWATASLDITNTVKKVRFYGYMAKGNGKYLGVDVVKVYGQQQLIAPWFSWVSPTEGTVLNSASNTITCGYNATTLPNGTYNGQVKFTTDDPTNPVDSSAVVLTVSAASPPAVPSLSAPANASNTYDPTPTFDWADASGATSYTIQVDNNSNFSSPEINQVVASSTYTPASLADGTYSWRALATNANGSSAYSSAWTVTKASLGTPTILSTSIVGSDLVIDWNNIDGADRYNVYYSTDPYSFTLYTTVMGNTNSTYTYTNVGTNGKMFFLIKAANALTKEAPKKIEIAKPASAK